MRLAERTKAIKPSPTLTMNAKAKVAVVPGSAFGDDKFIRLSYATSMENITKGLDRIEKALSELK